MDPAAEVHAMLYDAIDFEKVQARRYDGPSCVCTSGGCCGQPPGEHSWENKTRPFEDPLTCTMWFGVCVVCCAKIIQPSNAPGLYHLIIPSKHLTATIRLIALAPSPEACLDELRQRAAAAGAPGAAVMARAAPGEE